MKRSLRYLLLVYIFLSSGHTIALTEILFAPQDKPTLRLLEFINKSKNRIHAAVYMLTDKTIAQALILAKNTRNVDVQLVIDKISYESSFGKGKILEENGIPIFIYESGKTSSSGRTFFNNPIMHHKFALFDNTLWTGSFNWTVAANRYNQENVVITNNKKVLQRFDDCFKQLKTSCQKKLASNEPKNSDFGSLKTLYKLWNRFF